MWDRLHASMRHWCRLIGSGSPGASTLERDGVVAPIVPAARERSVANAVAYTSASGLAAAYGELAAAYDAIGAQWTVWVHPGDAEGAALLERAGHVLDAQPEGMVADLRDAPERPPAGALEDWTRDGDIADVALVNDRAYPFGTDSFARAFAEFPADELGVYVARRDGRRVGCLVTADHEANTEIQMVAVIPEARGQGTAGKLLAHALADAAERGQETSTLVATKLGRPIYDRLGYRGLGTLQMWERRR